MFRTIERESDMDWIGLNQQFRKLRVNGCEGGRLTIDYHLSRRLKPSLREVQRQKQEQRQRLLRRLQMRRQCKSEEDQKTSISMGSSAGCFHCSRLPEPLRCLSGSTDDHQQQQRSHNSIPPCFIPYITGHKGYETVCCFSPFEQEGRSCCTLGSSKEIPWNKRIIPSLSGTCHPWILALITIRNLITITLLNPVSGHEITLPGSPISWSDYEEAPGLVFSMSHSYTPCYTVFIIVNYSKPNLLFFRKGDRVWTRLSLPWHLNSFNTFRGDLYALRASEGARYLLAAYTTHPIPCIMKFAMDTSQLPSPKIHHCFQHHLVESPNGEELLLVLENVKLGDKCDENIFLTTGFHVFKADLSKKMWIRKETLGDRVLIVAELQTLFLSAASVGHGVKGNCIYFPSLSATGQTTLKMFDLDSEMVTDSPFSIPSNAGLFMFAPSVC